MMVALIEVSAAMAMTSEMMAAPGAPNAARSKSAATASDRLIAAMPRPFQ